MTLKIIFANFTIFIIYFTLSNHLQELNLQVLTDNMYHHKSNRAEATQRRAQPETTAFQEAKRLRLREELTGEGAPVQD